VGRWFGRDAPPPPSVIERVEPVEIPILTETKRRLHRGEYDAAIRGAVDQVVVDIQRAYGVEFPEGWTLGDVLRDGTGKGMGHVPDFLERLVALYVPWRYGAPDARRDPAELLAVLQSLYAPRPMWQLYAEIRSPGSADATTTPAPPPDPRIGPRQVTEG